MIYSGASFAKTYLGRELGQWPLWIAHYGTNKPMGNDTWDEWAVFQYTSTGTIDGIAGNVDLNAMEEAFYNRYAGAVQADQRTRYDQGRRQRQARRLRTQPQRHGLRPAPAAWRIARRHRHVERGDPMPYVNGFPVTQYTLLEGSAYVSVRAVGSFLGGKVTWDSRTQKVYIYY